MGSVMTQYKGDLEQAYQTNVIFVFLGSSHDPEYLQEAGPDKIRGHQAG